MRSSYEEKKRKVRETLAQNVKKKGFMTPERKKKLRVIFQMINKIPFL